MMEGGALVATHAASSIRLALLSAGSGNWQVESGSGSISPAYGVKKTAPMARISASTKFPVDCGVLMLASRTAQPLGHFAYSRDSQTRNVEVYEYKNADTVYRFFFAKGEGDWTAGDWASDARFLYCVTTQASSRGVDDLSRIILVDGTFAKCRGASLVAHESTLVKWEWAPNEKNPSSRSAALEFAGRQS
jgi:hypothetical protein